MTPENAVKTNLTLLAVGLFLGVSTATATDPLPSWNATAPRMAVIAFVEKITKPGSPDFVPVAERIAVFDNEGKGIDEAKAKSWTVVDRKTDWKRVFPFER